MTPERWHRIEDVFRTVVEQPIGERDAYLTRVCGEDDTLRREVLSLLDSDTAEDFFAAPIKEATLALTDKEDRAGERIGAYLLTRLIGHGGMGAVYEAIRADDQFQQKVAIKLIKRGMDSEFVRNRFLRERQILASLEHPFIARLLDGGTTTEGMPYFVMEYVTGLPLTEYCRQHSLGLEDKLDLLCDVCEAVQHAHQKLVVHRDLKPSNILITADGKPKLLDFGIAKLLAPEPGEAVTRTETAVRLMTPDYASPEQVRGLPITTASDVYSLGVVLYELLAERRPYQFETYSPVAIEQAICHTVAPLPSDVAEKMHNVSGDSKSRGKKLLSALIPQPASLLRGDLDNLVMMALRKEPERRYASVEQLSDDIRRYLNGLPIRARADTFRYRTGKFIRRHKTGVAALAALVMLTFALAVLTVRLTRERARAERRFAQVRTLANTFLFDFHNKIENVPGTTEAREMVVKTALNYLDSLAQEAAGDAQLEWELAVAYHKVGDVQGDPWAANLGAPQQAMQSYQKGVALAESLNGKANNDLKVLRQLALGLFKLGTLQAQNGDQTTAHATLSRALAVAETLAAQTRELEDLQLLQNCHTRLGDTTLDTGDPQGGLASYRRALQMSERRFAEFPDDRAQLSLGQTRLRIGEALMSLGDLPAARSEFRQALTLMEAVAPRHPNETPYLRGLSLAWLWLGHVSGNPRQLNLGETQTALQAYREHLALSEKLAALDPKNALAQQDLAGAHQRLGEVFSQTQPAQSAAHYRQARDIIHKLLAAAPQETVFLEWEAYFLRGLGVALQRQGDRAGARQHLQQALQIFRELHRRDATNSRTRYNVNETLLALGDILLNSGEHDAALAAYREALALVETKTVEQSVDVYVRTRLAESYAGLNRYHAARAAAASATERLEHWRAARQFAQQSFDLWEGWSQHAPSTNFDRQHREQAARAVAECEAALAKLHVQVARQ
jgi:serine/threonine protein kinase/tetratricopeptide (TPR) repeat protein